MALLKGNTINNGKLQVMGTTESTKLILNGINFSVLSGAISSSQTSNDLVTAAEVSAYIKSL